MAQRRNEWWFGGVRRCVGALVAAGACGILVAELVGTATATGELRPGVLAIAIVALIGGLGLRRDTEVPDGGNRIGSLAEQAAGLAESAIVDAAVALLQPVLKAGGVPLAIHVGDELVEVFWTGRPPVMVDGFDAAPTGWVWTAPGATLERALEAARVDATALVLPALVGVGVTAWGDLWLNLEALQVVHLTGEVAALQSTTAHLLALIGDSAVEVATVSTDGEARLGSGVAMPLEEALARARRQRVGIRRLLDEHHLASLPSARLAVEQASWPPLVLVFLDADELDVETLGRVLLAANSERSGVTCLFLGGDAPHESAVRLECEPHSFRVDVLGPLDIVIPGPEPETDRSTDDDTRWRARLATESPEVVAPVADATSGGGVLVRVLGPVVIEGTGAPLGAKGTELVTYLALHPAGVSDDRIKEALWPAGGVQDKTLHNRVWAARQALGQDPSGELVLPHFGDGVGRLSASVRTDVDELEAAVHSAADDAPGSTERLRGALGLVRGRPFHERSGYEWAFADLHAAHAERVAIDAAHRLAELALAAGDSELARWAAEQGLLVVPGAEVAAQDRMRAFAAAHDLRGVDRAFRDLVASVGSAEEITPQTRGLYEELRRPSGALQQWAPPT